MSSGPIFSLGNAIKLMILGGVLAFATVVVKACQPPQGALDRFATASLKKLVSLEAPPPQPTQSFGTPEGEVSLTDYHGQVVLLNAWATWCPPCLAEMPSLNELERLRGSEDFAVVPISLDRTMEEAQQFYDRTEITHLPIVHDPNLTINAQLELPGLPTTILYDRYGREVARLPGEADWASEEALALIDHLIAR